MIAQIGEGDDVIVFPEKKKQYTINRKDDRVNSRQKDKSRNHFFGVVPLTYLGGENYETDIWIGDDDGVDGECWWLWR